MFEDFLNKHPSIRYVRFQWVDYSGVLHAMIIPKARVHTLKAGDCRVFAAQNSLITPISTAPRCSAEGPQRWQMVPDQTSIRTCGFRKSHASVMCFLSLVEPRYKNVEDRFEKCPRHALERSLQAFHKGLEPGSQILVGFEIEFVLLDAEGNLFEHLDHITGYSVLSGLRGKTLDLIEEISDALSRTNIPVYTIHTEMPYQLELVLCPAPPMEAIDSVIHAQETIKTIAVSHGLKASMSPRPVLKGSPQNGLHMHFSINPLPNKADAFIAGILANIKALCAFSMPNGESYVRVMDDGAGCFIGWGTENRDFPVRKVGENHWEFRFIDSTANLYLAVSTLLSAGLQGMDDKIELRWKDCTLFEAQITPENMEQYGITERMPKSLDVTLGAAKNNEVVKLCLGEPLLRQYLRLKYQELENFDRMPDEERRKKFLAFF